CAFRQQRAPRDITRITRCDIWQELLPHGRANAVGPDNKIGLNFRSIAELRDGGMISLHKVSQAPAAVIMHRRKGIAQEPEYAFPGCHDLWAREGTDDPPGCIKYLPRCNFYAKVDRVEPKSA